MRSDLSGYSVVLVGSWNRSIFVPAWLKKHLQIAGEIGMEFAVGNPTMPARLFFDDVALVVDDTRLIIAPTVFSDGYLPRIEDVSVAILRLLSHTPIRAAGVNFAFSEQAPSREIRDIFGGPDSIILADAKAVVSSSLVQRAISYKGFLINFKSAIDNSGTVRFDFNFHGDVRSADEASAAFLGKVIQMHEVALALLTENFGLTMEGSND